MSTLKVGAIRGVSASSDAITVTNDGSATAKLTSINDAPLTGSITHDSKEKIPEMLIMRTPYMLFDIINQS